MDLLLVENILSNLLGKKIRLEASISYNHGSPDACGYADELIDHQFMHRQLMLSL